MKQIFLSKMLKNNLIKNAIFKALYLPGVNSVYRKIYRRNIIKKLDNFKLANLTVSVEPSNLCNSRCAMCPYPKMVRPKKVMGMELFKKIVDDCFSEGIRNFNLNFYNEPFLDPLLFERVKYMKSKGLKVSFFSNASVLNESMHEKIFESGIDTISFSVDGAKKETYEKIRIGLDFDKTVRNVLSLLEAKNERGLKKPKIRVVFVKQKLNENELEEYKKFWSDKVGSIVISTDDNRNENSKYFKSVAGKKPFPCKQIWTEIIAMSNGKVALCCVDADGSVTLGDFNKQTLKEIWESDKFRKIRKLHLNYEADKIPLCKNCLHSYRMNLKSWWR